MKKIFAIITMLAMMMCFTSFAQNAYIPGNLIVVGTITGNASGVTNTIPWAKSYNTNISLAFNGGLQTFTLPNSTNIVGFAYGSGTAGSISYTLTNVTTVSYPTSPALVWLTTHPTTVTNGIISFTTYGTNMYGAYKETQ